MIRQIKYEILKPKPGIDAQMKMAPPIRSKYPKIPDDVRYSAVSILLFKRNKRVHTVLIKRTADGRTHSGQIGFPGGKVESNDFSLTHTALRECEEEVGVSSTDIQIFGALSSLYIPPSNFIVQPIVGYLSYEPTFKLSPLEVSEVYTIKLDDLYEPNVKKEYRIEQSGNRTEMITPCYDLNGLIIWGATAMMLSELEEIYHRIA